MKNILQGLNEVVDYKKGNLDGFRITTVMPKEISVTDIRNKLNLSQQEFSDKYGFSVGTIRNWEQGRRQPDGPARTLLFLIDQDPDMVNGILESYVKEKMVHF